MNKNIFTEPLFKSNQNKKITFLFFNKKTLIDIICILFILLFVYAAASKIVDYQKFRVELGKSPLLTSYAVFVAISIPTIEVIVSCLLTIPRFRLLALYAAFTLMVMFTVYILTILNFSNYIPCSCGGVLEDMNWSQHVIFNIAFIILSIIGIFKHGTYSHD